MRPRPAPVFEDAHTKSVLCATPSGPAAPTLIVTSPHQCLLFVYLFPHPTPVLRTRRWGAPHDFLYLLTTHLSRQYSVDSGRALARHGCCTLSLAVTMYPNPPRHRGGAGLGGASSAYEADQYERENEEKMSALHSRITNLKSVRAPNYV